MIRLCDLSLAVGGRLLFDRVSLQVAPGETVALLGPSGCGKSSLGRLLAGLLPGTAARRDALAVDSGAGFRWAGRALVCGEDVLCAGSRRLDRLRGRDIGLVVQGLGDALNPHLTVLGHVAELLARHRLAARDARAVCLAHDLPDHLHDRYPAHLSGGEIQRVLLALALLPRPRALVLDEPTSALDPDSRARALDGLACGAGQRAQLLITHDEDLAARLADRVALVENGAIRLAASAAPGRRGGDRSGRPANTHASTQPVLCLQDVSFAAGGRRILDQVSLEVPAGCCVAIRGPSGSGKSTLARIAVGLLAAQAGRSELPSPATPPAGGRRPVACALVSQHPHLAMAAHFTVREVLREALEAPAGWIARGRGFAFRRAAGNTTGHRPAEGPMAPGRQPRGSDRLAAVDARLCRLLERVGLPSDPAFAGQQVASLSGGEAQRLAIARALALEPVLIVADEPTAALDPGNRRQVVALLADLLRGGTVGVLLVTHDADVAEALGDIHYEMAEGRLVRRWARPHPGAPAVSEADRSTGAGSIAPLHPTRLVAPR